MFIFGIEELINALDVADTAIRESNDEMHKRHLSQLYWTIKKGIANYVIEVCRTTNELKNNREKIEELQSEIRELKTKQQ